MGKPWVAVKERDGEGGALYFASRTSVADVFGAETVRELAAQIQRASP